MFPATHRAMDDAKVTHAVCPDCSKWPRQLPFNLVSEICRLSEPLDWDASYVFEHVLRPAKKRVSNPSPLRRTAACWFDQTAFAALENPEQPYPLDARRSPLCLNTVGHSRSISRPHRRIAPSRSKMLRGVASSLSQGSHLMVEAGTGVGKSFAYLIPAAIFAVQNNTRVVISTNTINLQDQLIQKEFLSGVLDVKLDVRPPC